MRYLIQTVETYKIDTEAEVQAFIEEQKETALEKNYTIKSCSYTLKEKKSKKEIVDTAFSVKIIKEFSTFWDE